MNDNNLNKKLITWAATFLCVAVLLFFYFHAPILPILLAGAGTLLIVLFQNSKKK